MSMTSGGIHGSAGQIVTRAQETSALLLPAVVLVALVSFRGVQPAAARPLSSVARSAAVLRVCADPNNLPFSNSARQGFENRIADLVGRELHQPVEYTWWAQRRGNVRNTLNAGVCDLVVGTSAGMDMLATTRPYYKSTYVFVSRRDRHLGIQSFDDPALRHLKVGVRNVVGFTVYGDYRRPNPPARIIDAVEDGRVDVAVAWGPLAGYFARRATAPLDIVPVSPQVDLPYLPFVFDIAMGVRRADSTFRHQLDNIIARRHAGIDSILTAYGVPLVGARGAGTGS